MPNYREVRVWSGTEWEALSIAYPDLTPYAQKNAANTFTAVQTFSANIIRPTQVPIAMEVGTENLTTSTNGDSLVIGTKAFAVGRFSVAPVVIASVQYPTTGKNGFITIKTVSASQFTYEVDLNVPITDSQSPTFPLKFTYYAVQLQ